MQHGGRRINVSWGAMRQRKRDHRRTPALAGTLSRAPRAITIGAAPFDMPAASSGDSGTQQLPRLFRADVAHVARPRGNRDEPLDAAMTRWHANYDSTPFGATRDSYS